MSFCATPFERLSAYVDGQLTPDEELDVRRHLDLCTACREAVETLTALKEAVAGSAEARPVPHTLRERLGTLGRPRGRWRPRIVRIAVLAAAVVAAIGLARRWERGPADAVTQTLVADHLHFLQVVDAVEVASDDPEQIAAWFDGKVGFPVKVPRLESATLLGGRLCSLWGHKVALAFYEAGGKRLSLFVADPANVPGSRRDGCTAALGDYRVCFIPASSTLLAMVADERQTAALFPELRALAAPRP